MPTRFMTALLLLCLAVSQSATAADEPFVIRDAAEFAKIVPASSKVEKLAGGMGFTEGPCWFDDARGGYLIFSDIPANQLKRWSAADGLGVFRENSNYANGNTRDREGRLVTCEHQARRVTRTERDGSITLLADRYQGKILLPESCANVTFGGKDGDELFITASKSLYRVKLKTTGPRGR